MKKKVRPSKVRGNIQAPPSKSFAQRAVAVAALAEGTSEILFPGTSDDVRAAINVTRQLGATVNHSGISLKIKGGIKPPESVLDCGEAGLSIRMFSSLAAVLGTRVTLTGRGSLLKRPMNVVEDSLRAMGVECSTDNGYLPLTVRGPIRGGKVEVDGSFSSQVLTGMLIAAPYADDDLKIVVNNLKSRPYIDITLAVMNSFGVMVENHDYAVFYVKSGQRYLAARYSVEGDWSAAAFFLVAGAVAGKVRVENISAGSPQADKAILDALRYSGASVTIAENAVTIEKGTLKSFDFDATDCPDLFPPLVSLAAFCSGTSRIKGVGRLVHKESNRAFTLREEFGKLGVRIVLDNDIMQVTGGGCKGGNVFSHDDHRIAMACAIAALAADGNVEIDGAGAVAKSYPGFFEDLEKITPEQYGIVDV
jgi:3-phosphoshikimate 1-carboxyvinyltransferase